MEKIKTIIIAGPTASGKTDLAVQLASLCNGEIISADSMQVYRRMDIGTAKPTLEERGGIPHHMIDIIEPGEEFSAARFASLALEKIRGMHERGKNPFVAGGTGLYIKTLTHGIFKGPEADPALRARLEREADEHGSARLHERLKEVDPAGAAAIHPNNRARVIRAIEVYTLSKKPISEYHREHAFSDEPLQTLKIGLAVDREELYGRINERVDRMMARGLLAETRGLLDAGYSPSLKPMGGLGYKEMTGCIEGRCALDEAVELLKMNTRRYAKRQMTWFGKDPGIRWFNPGQKKDIIEAVKEFLN
ncbi:MAG: tRNA (adenosine(37)-N6)-dimethylallyltransferase MiaA [Deltaproteobacteria bacterium RBG_19FT_COMBO_58_16]|nr:MAG: tRNA (adenosine(37)-N6)-dimethylallyltransferase MiaA [Deltaproteobacteria bacterium RBG_19FT_COMBO_58_16]